MADKIKMIAGDMLHITAHGPEPLQAGDEFEVDAKEAEDLEKRGLAQRSTTEEPKAAKNRKAAGG